MKYVKLTYAPKRNVAGWTSWSPDGLTPYVIIAKCKSFRYIVEAVCVVEGDLTINNPYLRTLHSRMYYKDRFR